MLGFEEFYRSYKCYKYYTKIAYNSYHTYNTYDKKTIATPKSGYYIINQFAINLRIAHWAHIHNGVLGGHRAVNINLRNVAFVASDVLLQ